MLAERDALRALPARAPRAERGRAGARAALRLLLLLAPLCVLLVPERAEAYTWMIRHGYTNCGTCHADPSGGELLNDFGRLQGDTLLRMQYGSSGGDSSTGPLFGAFENPEGLLLGGSYRHMAIYDVDESDFTTFPMQFDLYGQVKVGAFRAAASVGIARVDVGSPHARPAQVTTAQGEDMNVISRSHWVGADISDEVLVRGGRINLPFGMRIPEHVMWVRDATRTDRESDQHHGVAVSYSGDSLRGEVMAIAGNYQINPDRYRERGYSAYVEALVSDYWGVGVSSLITRADADFRTLEEEETVRQAHGAMARGRIIPELVLLFEADALLKSRRDLGYVGFLQADYEVVQGLHLMATGELLDEGYQDEIGGVATEKAPGFGEPKLGGWLSVDWFFYKQLELRVDAVFRQEDNTQLLAQLHLYL